MKNLSNFISKTLPPCKFRNILDNTFSICELVKDVDKYA